MTVTTIVGTPIRLHRLGVRWFVDGHLVRELRLGQPDPESVTLITSQGRFVVTRAVFQAALYATQEHPICPA